MTSFGYDEEEKLETSEEGDNFCRNLKKICCYSVLPNKRVRTCSCSKKKIPLYTSLLGTLHAPFTISKFFKKKKKNEIQKNFLTQNVDNSKVTPRL